LLTAELAHLFALFVVQFAIFIGVEAFHHPLPHLFATRPLAGGGLVGWLLSFVLGLSDAC
jgi:hypothetical protein